MTKFIGDEVADDERNSSRDVFGGKELNGGRGCCRGWA